MDTNRGAQVPLRFPAPLRASAWRAGGASPRSRVPIGTWSVIRPEVVTWANLMTLARLLGGVGAFGIALAGGGEAWIYVGLAVYWVGDVFDGMLARSFHQETLLGAEFDILSDRIEVSLFYIIHASIHPEKTLVAVLFLLEFMVLDHWLSNQFVRWPIKSPNDFHRVDPLTWRWLWSRPGKALNTGLVTLLTIFASSSWPALVVIAGLVVARAFLWARVMRLSSNQRTAARAGARDGARRPGPASVVAVLTASLLALGRPAAAQPPANPEEATAPRPEA